MCMYVYPLEKHSHSHRVTVLPSFASTVTTGPALRQLRKWLWKQRSRRPGDSCIASTHTSSHSKITNTFHHEREFFSHEQRPKIPKLAGPSNSKKFSIAFEP